MAGYQPSYIKLYEDGTLFKRVEEAKKYLTECHLCPHGCGVDRSRQTGVCRAHDQAIVSSYGPHFGEEAVLVGMRGSGTIFFGYCNMKCVYCQNHELSFGGEGRAVSNEKLGDIMLQIQNVYGCHNINLVTPTHFVPNIIEAVYLAVQEGLRLPIVYNCGGYESVETLRLLDGIVDMYMPDFKYFDSERGRKYSKVAVYPEQAKAALKEMDRQVGGLKTDDKGLAYKGLLIRHLMLPGGLQDIKNVLKFIKEELSPDCLVNLMDQYYPAHRANKYQEINRRLSFKEYRQAHAFAKELGLRLA